MEEILTVAGLLLIFPLYAEDLSTRLREMAKNCRFAHMEEKVGISFLLSWK